MIGGMTRDSLKISSSPLPPASPSTAAAATSRSGLEREVGRLKSALHRSIATVEQHITSTDPYSPAALLADPTSTLCAAAAQVGLTSARRSASGKGGGDGSGSGDLPGILNGNGGENDGTAVG